MKIKMLFLLTAVCAVSLFCSGCFGGRSPMPGYYRLSTEPVKVPELSGLPEIASLRVELPDYLRRQELVETGGSNLMYMKTDARWGHVLSEGLRDALLCRLNAGTAAGKGPALRLEFQFWKFSGDRNGRFLVQGVCRGAVLGQQKKFQFPVDFSLPYDVRSTDSLIQAHDQAVVRLVRDTAREMKTLFQNAK